MVCVGILTESDDVFDHKCKERQGHPDAEDKKRPRKILEFEFLQFFGRFLRFFNALIDVGSVNLFDGEVHHTCLAEFQYP